MTELELALRAVVEFSLREARAVTAEPHGNMHKIASLSFLLERVTCNVIEVLTIHDLGESYIDEVEANARLDELKELRAELIALGIGARAIVDAG